MPQLPPPARVQRRALSSLKINSVHHCALGREVQQPGTNTHTHIYIWVYTVYRMYYVWYLAYAYDNNNNNLMLV